MSGSNERIYRTLLTELAPMFFILFYSSDERARVSTFGFANGNPYYELAYDNAPEKGYKTVQDQAITITFDVGTLAPGASQTFEYYTSLDNRDFEDVLADITDAEGSDDEGTESGRDGDGIPDDEQAHVKYAANPVAGNGHYVTLQSEGCDTVDELGVKDIDEYGTDGTYKYPLGLVDFAVTCTDVGATTTITLFYDEEYNTTGWKTRKYLKGKFIDVPGATFGTAVVGGRTVTTLRYEVTDGGLLDADATPNGLIVDPAGPAVLAATAPNTGLPRENIAASVLALAIGIGAIVRYAYTAARRVTTT